MRRDSADGATWRNSEKSEKEREMESKMQAKQKEKLPEIKLGTRNSRVAAAAFGS